MMKKLLPFLFFAPLLAYDNAWKWEPACNGSYWECCFHGTLGIEGLYWKPCIEPFTYGTIGPDNHQTFLELSSKYRWGFRAFATISDPCERYFASLDWIYYNNTTTVQVSNKTDLTILSQSDLDREAATSIKAQQKMRYNRVSFKAGKNFCRYFFAYLGGGWRQIRLRRFSENQGTHVLTTKLKSEFSGGAIEGGVGAQAEVLCGVGASVRVGALAMIGNRCSIQYVSGRFETASAVFDQTEPSRTICASGLEVRTSVHYTKVCQGLTIRGEIGYELDYFFDVLSINKPDVNSVNRFSTNAGFGGPFVALSVGF